MINESVHALTRIISEPSVVGAAAEILPVTVLAGGIPGALSALAGDTWSTLKKVSVYTPFFMFLFSVFDFNNKSELASAQGAVGIISIPLSYWVGYCLSKEYLSRKNKNK